MSDTPNFSSVPADRPWALCHSGGGLRAFVASAVFTLVIMKQKMPPGLNSTVYENFHRAFGVSGGSWFLFAATHGTLAKMDASWEVDQLIKQLIDTGAIRDGDFAARTAEIHEKLAPMLRAVGNEWQETCCWCPAFCGCLQCLCDFCFTFCCCRRRYPLSKALNKSAGEAALLLS